MPHIDQKDHYDAPFYGLRQRSQRQDSLRAQLADLHVIANRLGLHDAADWLSRYADLGVQRDRLEAS